MCAGGDAGSRRGPYFEKLQRVEHTRAEQGEAAAAAATAVEATSAGECGGLLVRRDAIAGTLMTYDA